MIKIVHGLTKYFNFDPTQDLDFEYTNHYDSLRRMKGVEVVPFFYDCITEIGQARMNEELFKLIQKEKPDVFLTTMPNERLDKKMLLKIKDMTISLGWFGDDHWHFDNCGKYWVPYMSWATTTYAKAVPKYHKIGCKNVMYTQLGANQWIFTPPEKSNAQAHYKYDVSFTGAYYPARGKIIRVIEEAGIRVEARGTGWPNGRLAADQMNALVHQTKINIDINPHSSYIGIKPFVRFFFKRENGKISPDFLNVYDNAREWWQKRIPLTKQRTFNSAVAGGFVLTQMTYDLADYYEIGKEVVAFNSTGELIEKIKYYLDHEDEREVIARAGYERTIRDHTYEKRYRDIFQRMGLGNKFS